VLLPPSNYWTEAVGAFTDLYNETEETSWAGPGPAFAPTNGPAYGLNGSCPDPESSFWPPSGACGMTGPEEQYEEYKFKLRNLDIIHGHDATNADAPLFLCYTSHIVHEPLQVPNTTWNHFDFIAGAAVGDFQYHRQTYHSMVYYMDTVVGEMVQALTAKGMWENTLWVHQSDNGGPSFTGSDHTANNYPQKGSKMANCERTAMAKCLFWVAVPSHTMCKPTSRLISGQGGIRVNAFVSGGLLKTVAPAMIGKKLDGFTHACDCE
jgi:hypothetical protein